MGENFSDVILKIDPLAPNCNRFVHEKALETENYIPLNSFNEVKHRLEKNNATFLALISLIKSGKFNPNSFIDGVRLLDLKKKLSKADKVRSIMGLIQIQSVIDSRFRQVRELCNLKIYPKRIERINENKIKIKFDKSGDLLNFSSAIHFHNTECECCFITTDRKDFKELDLSDSGIPYNIPKIEFIQDY